MSWEISFLNSIQTSFANPFWDKFFSIFTHFGEWYFYVILAILLLFFPKTRKIGIGIALALIFGLIFGNLLLKNVIGRARPYNDVNALIHLKDLLIAQPSDYSFPSGHALASFNAALTLFFHNKKYGAFALVWAAVMSFSRLYLFVHYPTDIIGGIVLAACCATAAFFLVKFILKKLPENKFLGN